MTVANPIKPLKKGDASQLVRDVAYLAFIKDVKQRIQSAQIKAAVKVNQELLLLYWDVGEHIIARQAEANWGDGFLEQMSRDLRAEFPEMKGFSYRNLYNMRKWVLFWKPFGRQLVAQLEKPGLVKQAASQLEKSELVQQLVSQIQRGHNLLIINKIKDATKALLHEQRSKQSWIEPFRTEKMSYAE